MKSITMTKLLSVIVSIAFILGQVARLQLGNIGVLLLDVVVGGIVCVWFISKLYLKRKQLKTQLASQASAVKLFAGFIGVGVISLLLFSPHLTLNQFVTALLYPVRLSLYVSLFILVRSFAISNRELVKKLMLGVGGSIVAIGYVQYFFYPHLRNLYYLGWDDHLYRMFSVFLDPNFAGAFFVLLFLFVLDLALSVKKQSDRLFLSGLGIGTLIALYLTYSRTGFIMLLVGGGMYLLTYTSKKVVLGVLALFLILFILLANTKIEGLNPLRTASSTARIESARQSLSIIQQYPLLGVGFNAYRYAQVERGFREETLSVPSHADAGTDNSYLFVLATTGSIGFGIFAVFWYIVMRKTKQLTEENVKFARSLFAALGSVLVGSLFLNILFYPMLVGWLAVHAGLIRRR